MAGPEEGKNNAVSETHGAYHKRMTRAMNRADTIREMRSSLRQDTQDSPQTSSEASAIPSGTEEPISVSPINPQPDKE